MEAALSESEVLIPETLIFVPEMAAEPVPAAIEKETEQPVGGHEHQNWVLEEITAARQSDSQASAFELFLEDAPRRKKQQRTSGRTDSPGWMRKADWGCCMRWRQPMRFPKTGSQC